MAIYEYDCPQCGTFEVTQKMSDPSLTVHESCGSPVQRRISLTSFSLKGSGWYSDGYSSKSGGSSAEKTDKPVKSEKAEKADKAEAAPAAPCGAPVGSCGGGACEAAKA